ncbi:LAQU0S03e01398g1_1 [Lachancea quebecensis]|uniref:LAQU0S03e01398g1_1 n=1 Tax=Lachancea quebecensis TaxID=1654605 RepID=A0A0P1KP75_9SACH|nr:LAQU0S03e01398g1_1 [Lachancea quebecensis]
MFRNDWKLSINSKTFDALDCSLFRNFKFMTVVNYAFFVVFLTAMKIALFVSDVYTCIKLLAFNSWSNNVVPPYIPFRISKWLFSGCILASIVLIAWEIINGIRIYRTRNISLTYVNNFSRGVYSLSQYNKFCVYNRISPSGAYQKIAFFTFFELKDCLRLLVADTPRQVINALTLWSVVVTVDQSKDLGRVLSPKDVVAKIKTIAQTNHEEAVLLSFMLFSFAIWAFFITKFIAACLCSIYVYYRIFNERNTSGLKEYVCVTVSEHINHLVDKYQRRKQFNMVNLSHGLSSSSLLQADDLEAGPWKNAAEMNAESLELEDYSESYANASTANLLAKEPAAPAIPRLNKWASVDTLPTFDAAGAVEAASPIASTNQTALQKRTAFDPILRSETFESSRPPKENPFAPRLISTNTFNSVKTTSTVPSYYFDRDASLEAPGAPEKPRVRPAPPPPPPSDKVNTPEQAYFGDFAASSDSLAQRNASMLAHRDRIEREDYEFYTRSQHASGDAPL